MKIKKEVYHSQDVIYRIIKRSKSIGVVNITDGEIWDLDIAPQYRRQGYATKLMEQVIKDFGNEDITLVASPDEKDDISPACLRKFYRKLGFVSDKKHHDYMVRKANKSS